MKLTKRALAVVLALVLLCVGVPFAAAKDVTIVDSGTCGGNLTWTLNSEGTLTVSGEGAMDWFGTINEGDVTRTAAPWGQYCQTIKTVVIGDGVTSISSYVFYNCTALESVELGKDVMHIGEYAFYCCAALISVNLPDGLMCIRNYAFVECISLDTLEIPESVTVMDGHVFGWDQYNMPFLLCKKGSYAAAWAEEHEQAYALIDGTDEENTISETVNAKLSYTIDRRTRTLYVNNEGKMNSLIGETAPWSKYQQYICNLVLSQNCTSVGAGVFQSSYCLKHVVLPSGLETIGASAFAYCSKLKEIVIPDTVTSIGERAFEHCYSLQDVVIGKSVRTIGQLAFSQCTGTQNYMVHPENESFSSADGALLDKPQTILLYCPAQKEAYTTPDSVKTIADFAFDDCRLLKSISLPDGMKTIGNFAFDGCTSLAEITIPASVQTIGTCAFYNCSALEHVEIPDAVATINNQSFQNCSSLRSVTIGAGVQRILHNAFYRCDSLKTITLPSGVRTIEELALSGNGLEEIYIYAPECSISEGALNSTATVFGYAGSSAETYADNYGLTFVQLDPHEHNFEETKRNEPTCDKPGLVQYRCTICGAYKLEELPATGDHNYLFVGYEPFSIEEHLAVYQCNVCKGRQTTAIAHSFGDWALDSEPTCTEKGSASRVCAVCGFWNQIEIAAKGHTYSDWTRFLQEGDPSNAIEIRFCSVCGSFDLRQALPDDPTDPDQPHLEHTFAATPDIAAVMPTCTQDGHGPGWICTTPGCGYVLYEDGNYKALGHNWILRRTIAAACEVDGKKIYECSRCQATDERDKTPALGHIDEDGNKVCDRCGVTIDYGTLTEAQKTCKHDWTSKDFSAGNMASPANCVSAATYYLICTKCGANARLVPEAKDKVVADPTGKPDPNAHPADKLKVTKAAVPATCRTAGETEEKTCTLCGKVAVESTLTPSDPNAHVAADGATANCSRGIICVNFGKTLQKDPNKHPEDQIRVIKTGKEPTCGTAGYKAVLYCTACEKMIQTDEVIPATGKHTQKTAATCSKKAVCTVCGMEYGDLDTTKHNLERRAAVAVSCTTDGSKEYWECKDCKKLFSDYEGTMETTEAALVIKADGQSHTDANDDGVCDRCGTVLREPEPQEEEPQGFFAKIGAFFRNLFDRIFGIFRR